MKPAGKLSQKECCMSNKRNHRKNRKPPSWLKTAHREATDPTDIGRKEKVGRLVSPLEEIPPPPDWKQEKIFLCIPSTGSEHVRLSQYVEAELRMSGHEIVSLRSVSKPVDHSRNLTIDAFLTAPAAQKCNWYYTIDSDTVPFPPQHPEIPEGTLNRLLGHKKKVICGMTFSTKKGALWIPVMGENATSSWSPDWSVYAQKTYPLVKIDGIGAACMLIHRSVVEKVMELFGVCWRDHYDENSGRRVLGQDLDFSRKIRAVGGEIWADMDIVCDHYKLVNLKDFAIAQRDLMNTLRIIARAMHKHWGNLDIAAEVLFRGQIDLEGMKDLIAEDKVMFPEIKQEEPELVAK